MKPWHVVGALHRRIVIARRERANELVMRDLAIEALGLQARYPALRDPEVMRTLTEIALERIGRGVPTTLTQVVRECKDVLKRWHQP